jgi:thioester reductase-like protein
MSGRANAPMIPVAIVGIACRFPGANGVDELWRLARDGARAVTDVPVDRWSVDDFFSPEPGTPGRISCRVGGFVDGVERFDAGFFGMSPREAAQTDPQQRILLEVCWEAFENAGLPPAELAGRSVASFIGVQRNDYGRLMPEVEQYNAYTIAGNQFSMTVSRLSHFFDLRGPSLALDAGCSSVLVAMHLACASLETGESDLALAGGVHLNLAPHDSVAASQAWMLSPSGRCLSFDERADGYVRSEGCGLFVLKRLDDAVADGDAVLAVVRGTSFSQDGRPGGFTSPWGPEVERAFRRALARAHVSPSSIGYVEAHGVGSPVADATEYQAIARALADDGAPSDSPCYLGSIKPNIGHAESASGAASLIKAVAVLRSGEVPPLLDFERLDPTIPEALRTLIVPTALTPFPATSPRRAAVNAFGLGGTNATVVLEAAPAPPTRKDEDGLNALCLSARSPAALAALAARYTYFLGAHDAASVAEACAASHRRARFPHRAVILGSTVAELREGLERLTNASVTSGPPHVVRGEAPEGDPRALFLFRQDSWPEATLSELKSRWAPFREALDEARREPCEDFVVHALAAARMWTSLGVVPERVVTDHATRAAAAAFAGAGPLDAVLRAMQCASTAGLKPLAVVVFAAETGEELTLDALVSSKGPAPTAEAASELCRAHAQSCDLLIDLPGGGLYDVRSRAPTFAPAEGRTWLLASLAALFVRGTEIDFRRLEATRPRHVPLPNYPFERKRCWISPLGPGSGQPSIFGADARGTQPPVEASVLATDEGEKQRAVTTLLRRAAASALGRREAEIPDDAPLRDLGIGSIDMLQMLEVVRGATGDALDPGRFMDQPSIVEIASRIVFGTGDDLRVVDLSTEGNLEPSIDASALPCTVGSPRAIFLTGATGFLGAFLLHELLLQTDATIYCLVRAIDSLEGERKIGDNLARYALPTAAMLDRVRIVIGDLDEPLLGLSGDSFDRLGQRLDEIYHCGARVNWAAPYRALHGANVRGTREIVRLAAHMKRKPIHHVSTVGVFPLGLPGAGTVYERDGLIVPARSEDLGTGYNQSKWVAEKLLYAAGSRRGLPVSIYRPGFVTGRSDTGTTQMERRDFIAAFLKGIVQMGEAPDWDVALDLLPVDYLARAIVKLARTPASPGHPMAYNMINPEPLPYREVYELLRADGYAIETKPYGQWRDRVLALAREPGANALFPFWPYYSEMTLERVKALELHMRGAMPFDDRNVREGLRATDVRCPTVRDVVPVYAEFFRRAGYFPSPKATAVPAGR